MIFIFSFYLFSIVFFSCVCLFICCSYRDGESRPYQGPRTKDGILSFGEEMHGPAVIGITNEKEFKKELHKHAVVFAFFPAKTNVEAKNAFNSVAYRLQGMNRFVVVDTNKYEELNELKTQYNVKSDEATLVMITKGTESLLYTGPW